MAKSIRSKWKRKMRAIKRQRYAVVERKRLEKTLGIGESAEMEEAATNKDSTENTRMKIQDNTTADGDVKMQTDQVVGKRLGNSAQKKLKQRKTLKRLRLKKGQFKWTPQKH